MEDGTNTLPDPKPQPKPGQTITEGLKPLKIDAGRAPSYTEKDSWLVRNITPIMAILVLAFAFAFFIFVLRFDFTKPSMQKDIVIYMLGVVSTLITAVVTYYFGSSHSSGTKSKFLEKIHQQKNGSKDAT